VRPPISPLKAVAPVNAFKQLYAVIASVRAFWAIAPPLYVVPDIIPGGNPVVPVTGVDPTSPMITEFPVFDTPAAANIAKSLALANVHEIVPI
jgi:hypothetical protein